MDRADLSEMLKRLAAGNVIAKRWSHRILGKRRLSHLHQVMQDRQSATKLHMKSDEVEGIMRIPPTDVMAIRYTWEVAGELWLQFERMVIKVTRRFAGRVGMGESDIPDLTSEATVAFLKAVRGYSDLNFEFTTYFCTAVKTDLRRYVKRMRGLAGNNEKLLIAYRAEWERLRVSGEDCSFEAVCKSLGLDKKQCEKLWGTLIEPTNEGEMAESLGRTVVDKSAPAVDVELASAISMVDMSVLERDAWVSQESIRGLFPHSYATLKEVAEAHGVTPQAAAFAAERANVKIGRHLRKKGFSPVG